MSTAPIARCSPRACPPRQRRHRGHALLERTRRHHQHRGLARRRPRRCSPSPSRTSAPSTPSTTPSPTSRRALRPGSGDGRTSAPVPVARAVRDPPHRRRSRPLDRLLSRRRRSVARARAAGARSRVLLDRRARPGDARALVARIRARRDLVTRRVPTSLSRRHGRLRSPALARRHAALLLRDRNRRAERDRLDAGGCGVLPRPRRPPARVPRDARRAAPSRRGICRGRSGRTVPDRAAPPYTITWHQEQRAELRDLFELADDSHEQVDRYIDLGRVLVAHDHRSGEVVGHLQLIPTDEPGVTEIKSLAVRAGFRRRGVGRALVERALATCRDEHARAVTVTTAIADIDNLRFYQRCGFRASTIERDVFSPDAGYRPGLSAGGIPVPRRDPVRSQRGRTRPGGVGDGRIDERRPSESAARMLQTSTRWSHCGSAPCGRRTIS